jgi:thiol-disulfide isomerase/thioredoxin
MPAARIVPLFLAVLASYQSTCQSSAGSGQAPGAAPAETEVTLNGVDTGALTSREKKEWSTWVSELLAPCPSEPVNIAQCVKESRRCAKCLPAARLLVKQVRAGRSRSQAEEAFFARFSPDRIKSIDVGDSPSQGPSSAPVTIVEFADFECPHCRHAAPLLEKQVESHPGKVRLVYKFFPLQSHVHGESAARGTVAAMKQGKFWELHHLLFEHQETLENRDIEKFAKELGLDMAKWKADWAAEATADRVSRDRKQGDVLGIRGTPAIYINGREFELAKFDMGEDLEDWINLEIELATGVATPSASSATPLSSAGPNKVGVTPAAVPSASKPAHDTIGATAKP